MAWLILHGDDGEAFLCNTDQIQTVHQSEDEEGTILIWNKTYETAPRGYRWMRVMEQFEEVKRMLCK